jgi:hypothetical protein
MSNNETIGQVLLQAAIDNKLICSKELNFIPEAESVIIPGADRMFSVLSDISKGNHTYDPSVVQSICRYLFGKSVEAVISWSQTKDGKFSVYYDPKHIIDMNLHAEVPKKYIPLVQKSCKQGDILFKAHMKWTEQRLKQSKIVDLADEVKQLFTWCSRIGMSYALEKKYHKPTWFMHFGTW